MFTVAVGQAAIGQAAGSLVQPAAEAGKGLYGCLKRKYDYAKHLTENYNKLLTEKQVLICKKEDAERRIFIKGQTMEPTKECSFWLHRVEEKNNEVGQLEMRYNKEKDASCCFFRLFPRAKLSKDILKMTQSVVALKEEMNSMTNTLEQKDIFTDRKLPKELNDVPSITQHVEKLLNFLKDKEVNRIGIHGSYGVGKTTIMKSLHTRVEKDNMFDSVIWVTVPKDGRVDQIQKAVLERLNVRNEDGGSEDRIGNLISQVLDKKNYLLLLDEVNSAIDLDRIGISHDHGKVVLASRSKPICHGMDLDEQYEVNRLSKEDAWKLFHDIVGKEVNNPLLQTKAELILKQCGGLPQVIKALGKYLKGNCREDFFSMTLTSLRTHKAPPLEPMQEVFDAFKLFYDVLDDRLQFSLLYSASFPDDHEIYRDHLIECWKAEQLIPEDETFTIARDCGKVMLQKLLDRHLFEQGKSKKFVRLPMLFRNAALRMANKHKTLELLATDARVVPHDYFTVEKWRNARVISFIHKDVNLPISPECLNVSTLFLQNSRSVTTLDESFFQHMSGLKVLDLCGTGIESLPPSVSKLSNLKALYVNDCRRLTWLPEEIKQVKDLEVLDVSSTGMLGLPIVIGDLTHLRCLRASFRVLMGNENCIDSLLVAMIPPNMHSNGNCIDTLPVDVIPANTLSNGNCIDTPPVDDIIPPNTLSKLHLLEELSIGVDPMDPRWINIATRIAEEVARLEMLTSISLYFPSVECLETFWSCRKTINAQAKRGLRSFKLFVGSYQRTQAHEINVSQLTASGYLRYSAGAGTPMVIKDVLEQACAFELIAHQNIHSLSEFGVEKMGCLELCIVEECNEMTTVIGSDASANAAFQSLKELRLLRLQKLNSICHGPVTLGNFSQLSTLTFYDCPKIMKIFSFEITTQLSHLKHLRVEECPEVIKIIEEAGSPSVRPVPSPETVELVSLEGLEVLELVNLKGLAHIYHDESFEWPAPALKKIEIMGCPNLSNLSLGVRNAPELHSIRCSKTWWSALASLEGEVRERLEKYCLFVTEE
ncbi:putative disease resistance protein [Drosera capensis]